MNSMNFLFKFTKLLKISPITPQKGFLILILGSFLTYSTDTNRTTEQVYTIYSHFFFINPHLIQGIYL